MNKINILLVLILGLIIIGAYLFFKPQTKQQDQIQTPVVQATSTNIVAPGNKAQTQTLNISLINFAFSPNTLNINIGDTVIWTNNDSAPHQIKGDSLTSISGTAMNKGQTYSFTFNDIGTFNYHCAIHPSMKGIITVK